jgi:hypothetical protein
MVIANGSQSERQCCTHCMSEATRDLSAALDKWKKMDLGKRTEQEKAGKEASVNRVVRRPI